MRTTSAADANRHFSKLLRDVRDGETVTITSRGVPVARLVPINDRLEIEARREDAKRRLVAFLRDRPALNLETMTRDEIYDLEGYP